jgi:CBS domain-containing protein
MRTRIALVAITPIAVITAGALVQAATVQSSGAEPSPSSTPTTPVVVSPIPPDQLIAYRGLNTAAATAEGSKLVLDLGGALLLHGAAAGVAGVAGATPAVPVAQVATAVTSPITASTDTVTPEQRAAWERVAMCEEGGNWTTDGGRFSGGLGISRANWDAYGGTQYAAEGAEATPDQQIMVAERIQSSPPDQDGCHGW